MKAVHLILVLAVLSINSNVGDSNQDEEIILTINSSNQASSSGDFPYSLYLVVKPTIDTENNGQGADTYNISFQRTNVYRLQTLTFQNDTNVTTSESSPSAFYKMDDGQGLLCMIREGMRWKLRGQFCVEKLKVTLHGAEISLDVTNVRVGTQHVSLSKCNGKLSGNTENIPANSFPRRSQLVNVNQRSRRQSIGRYSKRSRQRDKRKAVESYTVELLVVIDYEAYKKWDGMFGTADNLTTLEQIKQYYSYIFNGIDLRFRSIQSQPFEINMAFSGFVVAQTEEESFWTSTSTIEDQVLLNGQRLMINASEALEKFQVWLDDEASTLPQYDHAILFSGGDLTYAGNTGNTGLAFAESMCRNISNSSIVEEAFDFRTVTYAIRQLARSLGARDDMDNNDCLEFFNFIMAPKFKLPVKSFPTNRWKFSTCTVQYFNDYISKLNEDGLNCLQETPLDKRYPGDVVFYIQDLPGTVYTAKQQCENIHGPVSDICRARMKPSDYPKLCTGLPCTTADSVDCEYILPADGTPCGNMKYCFEGQCLEFEDAVKGVNDCVFGDDPNDACKETIVKEPYLCYNESVRYACCASCARVEIGLSGCEYGDRQASCDQDCSSSETKSVCCLTCADGPVPSVQPPDDWFTFTSSSSTTLPTTSTTVSSLSSSVTSTNPVATTPSTTELQIESSSSPTPTEAAVETTSTKTTLLTKLMTKSHETSKTTTMRTKTTSCDVPVSTTTSSTRPTSSKSTPITYTLSSTQTVTPYTGQTKSPSPIPSPTGVTLPKPSTKSAQMENTSAMPVTAAQRVTTVPSPSENPKQFTKKTVSSTDKTPCTNGESTKSRQVGKIAMETRPTKTVLGCAKFCKAFEQTARVTGPKFTLYDRMFFKELARSMRQSQRNIRQRLQSAIKHLYLGVTKQIQRHQESETESFVYNDVINPNVELPSQDDDDINRLLIPIWRRQHAVLLRNVGHDVKRMRYKVLMMVNRHLRH